MSTQSGFTSAHILNHSSTAAQSFPRTEAVFVKTSGVLEAQFVNDPSTGSPTFVNFGTVAAGTVLNISIKQTSSVTAADLILLR